jgi:hypothetical protein
MWLVVPPHAMPRVSSSGPRVMAGSSGCDMIGWARCVWGSTPPGETMRPAASITCAPSVGRSPGAATAAMASPWIPMSPTNAPWGVITCPLRTTMSSMRRG